MGDTLIGDPVVARAAREMSGCGRPVMTYHAASSAAAIGVKIIYCGAITSYGRGITSYV